MTDWLLTGFYLLFYALVHSLLAAQSIHYRSAIPAFSLFPEKLPKNKKGDQMIALINNYNIALN